MNNEDILKKRRKKYFDIDKKIVPDFPKNMLLELSNICNHNCIFCANSKSNRENKCIDSSFAKKILKEAYNLGTREVGFYSTGEPLVDKNLEEYIREAKKLGYDYVYITTNGALLNEKRAESLIESGIDSIKFSINAGTKESYEFIHGKDDFDKVISNLKYLFKYRKKTNKNFKIYISCILTRYTQNDKQIIENNLKKYVDESVFLNCKNQCGVMYEVNEYLTVDCKSIEEYKNEICPLPFNKLHVTCEGYLTACCADFQNYLVVADLNKETLEKAWINEKFIELRTKHIEDKLEGTLCFNCINNSDTQIYPMVEDLSTKFEMKDFNKTKNIIERINCFKKQLIY